jgi:putative flippase GtrA
MRSSPESSSSSSPAGSRHQLPKFVLVGCLAAATHWSVVRLLVETLAAAPLQANVLGWLVAFGVSYTGHQRLTFADHKTSVRSSLPRFFLVSLGGFLINEIAYAALMRTAWLRYDLALAVVLVAVAVLTFVASRWWAFRHRPH